MDIYKMITDRIIEKLETGTVPWHKPWRSIGAPRNLVSKKFYRGVKYLAAHCTRLHLALLGNYPANQRTWRASAQGREVDTGGFLEGLRRWRRSEGGRRKPYGGDSPIFHTR
jgi:hypothetical protein